MAFTISQAGSANSTTSGSTLDITGITAAVGDFLVVCVGSDNAGSGGSASISSVTDGSGNTYTERGGLPTRDPGAANAGITQGFFTTTVTSALSSGTVTVNFSPNTTSKAAVIYKIVPGTGNQVSVREVGAGVTNSTTAASITATAVASGDLIIGAIAVEANATGTADSDTTNGSWSTAYSAIANTGTLLTSAVILAQYKETTGTGDQTYNWTNGATRDIAMNYLVLFEEAAPVGGKMKVYNGSTWDEKPVKWYNGSTWVEKPLKVYNGSTWVLA